jgi:hypothetical protein
MEILNTYQFMKGESDFLAGFQHLHRGYDHWQSFVRERPGGVAERLFGNYCRKIEWIAKDLITCPLFPSIVREGLKTEWNSDAFMVDAIIEKVMVLTPGQREVIETVLDRIIAGEHTIVEVNIPNDDTNRSGD